MRPFISLPHTNSSRTRLVRAIFGALLTISATAPAQTVDTLWIESWEGDWTRTWSVQGGTWQAGTPTSGPGSAFAGVGSAATVLAGDYPNRANTMLIRDLFFTVPPVEQNPRLRFWHWYSFSGGDIGTVEIKTANGSWQVISPSYVTTGSGVWTRVAIDLHALADSTVQIAFRLSSDCCNTSSGWYIDDIAVVKEKLVFRNPESWESELGGWYAETGTWEVGAPQSGPGSAHAGANCAATVLKGNYANSTSSRLISPPFVVPSTTQQPRLRIWHWYSFSGGDAGAVQIKMKNGDWQNLSPNYVNTSGGVWTNPTFDLSAYADSEVQIAFRLTADCCNSSSGWYIDDIEFDGLTTGVTERDSNPAVANDFGLHQSYPNPFNPTTTIAYGLPNSGYVSLKIFNLLGEEIATLVDAVLPAGQHQVVWNAREIKSGAYFYRLQTENFVQTRKLTLLK